MSGREAPPELVLEVLRRMQAAGVLNAVVLVGSWTIHFYREGVTGFDALGPVRSTDMDFMVPTPPRFAKSVKLAELLKDLGFIAQYGRTGFMKLVHSEVDVEFLVPERGRGSDKPYKVEGLGITAQPVRFADFLIEGAIPVKYGGLVVRVPEPVRFGLHKLIVSTRRGRADKAGKDLKHALDVLGALLGAGKGADIRKSFDSMPKPWQSTVLKALARANAPDLLSLLTKPS